jgi:hypothetical protein
MITSTTFAERLYNCSSFKEDKNYGKIITKITMDVISKSINNSKDSDDCSLFALLFEKFSKSASLRAIIKSDKGFVEDVLITYAEHLSSLLHRFDINYDETSYVYRYKIGGGIFGTTTKNNKTYNIDVSYRTAADTFYHLYYYKLNFFLYNQTHGLTNDGLVYIVANDSMYHVKYKADDYTINKGFLDYNIKNRTVRPSHQCLYCSQKNCKPRLITNIDRFII